MFGVNRKDAHNVSSPNPMHNANFGGANGGADLGSFSGGAPVVKNGKKEANDGSRKARSRFLPLVVFLALAVVAGAAAAAVLLVFQDVPTEYNNPPPNNGTVPVAPGTASLARCPENQLCHLMYEPQQQQDQEQQPQRRRRLAASSDDTTIDPSNRSGFAVARSYGKSNWERSPVADVDVPLIYFNECSESSCSVTLSSGPGTWFLMASERGRLATPEEHVARFLNQATFGATLNEIAAFPTTPKAWITQQLTETATSHRAYYRQRVNSMTTTTTPAGRPRKPCEDGSRWELVDLATPPPTDNLVNLQGANTRMLSFTPELEGKFAGNKILQLDPTQANACTTPSNTTIVYALSETQYYKHVPRVVLLDNTMAAPAITKEDDAGPKLCPNVEKSFVNMESCVIHPGKACEVLRPPSVLFTLAQESLRDLYSLTDSFVYAVKGLRLDTDNVSNSPCRGSYSRWIKAGTGKCAPATSLDADTIATLTSLLANSEDTNPTVRDVRVPSGAVCTATTASIGAKLTVGDDCWEHVHSDMYNVFDFSYWAEEDAHPGNKAAMNGGRPNPIKKIAEDAGVELMFPSNHIMTRWVQNRKKLSLIGRLGDDVDFSLLPTNLQTQKMAEKLGAVIDGEVNRAYGESCGSPNEVAGQPMLGARYLMGLSTSADTGGGPEQNLDQRLARARSAPSIWAMVNMYGNDQLRQRMAWALSQVLVISVEQLGNARTENFLHYYDIFVRHAFGNYRDLLKEVSFSAMMGDYLSYTGSQSFQYSNEIFPDENYAREIMQLFTVGLYKLNMDGTVVLGIDDKPVETYTNDDIMTMARTWTGFDRQASRGNLESLNLNNPRNYIDPMRVTGAKRDVFPKMNLYGGYIGDQYPLCIDMPNRSFLSTGATYRFLGSTPAPKLVQDPGALANDNDDIKRVELVAAQSALYKLLCNAAPSDPNTCRYKSEVVLQDTLPCNGIECTIDTVRVVALNETGRVFYEYVQPPCIQLSFFDGLQVRQNNNNYMCANPNMPVASEACCTESSNGALIDCNFHGERLTYATAKERCATRYTDPLRDTCDFTYVNTVCSPRIADQWSNVACDVKAKVASDGRVAIVHDLGSKTRDHVALTSRNWFRVGWSNDGSFPSASDNNCGISSSCDVVAGTNGEGDACLCNTTVIDLAVFDAKPSREAILANLHIGSIAPNSDSYNTAAASETAEGVVATYYKKDGALFDMDTVFELVVKTKTVYVRNMESEVQIVGTDKTFRNPPSMMDLVEATTRDALHETDAVLDHFFEHPNTAPFLAYRFIQRFVTSNPSPRYIETVATAFTNGDYEGFGSGKYGDLAATIAAVLLDPEARSVELDLDPAGGQLREPLLKVIHMMRSLNMEPRNEGQLQLNNLADMIGMQAHSAPDVFSFFKPEFSPAGPVADAGLKSPEGQILTPPSILAFLTGVKSMARFQGLTRCDSGFGHSYGGCDTYKGRLLASGSISYSPKADATAAQVIDDLDLLLTSGRLDPTARELLEDEYALELEETGDTDAAVVHVLQILAASPEFHSTNIPGRSGDIRSSKTVVVSTAAASDEPYKAVVYLFMAGGADSFSILVPHSNCQKAGADFDLFEEYKTVRTNVHIPKADLLPIDVPAGTQPCTTFGLNPNLVNVARMYAEGNAAFVANAGPLVEPVTYATWKDKTAALPKSLFAHNVQQQAIQSMIPDRASREGVLGRMTDQLAAQGFNTGSMSINGNNLVLQGAPSGAGPSMDVIGRTGNIASFTASSPRVQAAMDNLTDTCSSLYGETWSASMRQALDRGVFLKDAFDGVNANVTFPANVQLSQQFEQVARAIKARKALGNNRQTFFVQIGGFDTHNSLTALTARMGDIDGALGAFEAEMKVQGMWNNVVVVTASDFARTMTSNGAGTDHAWGGNHFMVGGSVKGGQIHGQFPEDLTASGALHIGRGRLIPTTSLNAVWNGVAEWMGVDTSVGLDKVVPNRGNFPAGDLFGSGDLFD